jgi:hypothetical protein
MLVIRIASSVEYPIKTRAGLVLDIPRAFSHLAITRTLKSDVQLRGFGLPVSCIRMGIVSD